MPDETGWPWILEPEMGQEDESPTGLRTPVPWEYQYKVADMPLTRVQVQEITERLSRLAVRSELVGACVPLLPLEIGADGSTVPSDTPPIIAERVGYGLYRVLVFPGDSNAETFARAIQLSGTYVSIRGVCNLITGTSGRLDGPVYLNIVCVEEAKREAGGEE